MEIFLYQNEKLLKVESENISSIFFLCSVSFFVYLWLLVLWVWTSGLRFVFICHFSSVNLSSEYEYFWVIFQAEIPVTVHVFWVTCSSPFLSLSHLSVPMVFLCLHQEWLLDTLSFSLFSGVRIRSSMLLFKSLSFLILLKFPPFFTVAAFWLQHNHLPVSLYWNLCFQSNVARPSPLGNKFMLLFVSALRNQSSVKMTIEDWNRLSTFCYIVGKIYFVLTSFYFCKLIYSEVWL